MDKILGLTRITKWIVVFMFVDLLNAVILDGTKYDQWLNTPYSAQIPYSIEGAAQLHVTGCTECKDEYRRNCTDEYQRIWSMYADIEDWVEAADARAENDLKVSCKRSESSELGQLSSSLFIFINRVYYARDDTGDCGEHLRDESCPVSAAQHMFPLVSCNTQKECTHSVYPHTIDCANRVQKAHFLRVDYQCIPEDDIHRLDSSVDTTSSSGYLLSHNYPDLYQEDTSLECRFSIQTADVDTLLSFYVLDFALQDQVNGECGNDYVEIQEIDADNRIRAARRWCAAQPQGFLTTTAAQHTRLVFHTDSDDQRRGFWLKYHAHTATEPMEDLEVQVTCREFDPDEEDLPTYPDTTSEPETPTTTTIITSTVNPIVTQEQTEPTSTTSSTTTPRANPSTIAMVTSPGDPTPTTEKANPSTVAMVTTPGIPTPTLGKAPPISAAKSGSTSNSAIRREIPAAAVGGSGANQNGRQGASQSEVDSASSESAESSGGGGDSEVIVIVAVIAGVLLLIGIIVGSVFLRRKFMKDTTQPMQAMEPKGKMANKYNHSNGSLKRSRSNGSLDNPGYGRPMPPPRDKIKIFMPSHSDSVLNSITSVHSDGYMTPITEDIEENVYEVIVTDSKPDKSAQSNGHSLKDTPNGSVRLENNSNGDTNVYYEHEYADMRA